MAVQAHAWDTRLHDPRLVEEVDAVHRSYHGGGQGCHQSLTIRVGLRPDRLPTNLLVL